MISVARAERRCLAKIDTRNAAGIVLKEEAMPRNASFDSEELDDGPRRFDAAEEIPMRPKRRRDDDDVEPLELGDSSNRMRFGKLSDRDQSGSW
jgi:hypothetical protein